MNMALESQHLLYSHFPQDCCSEIAARLRDNESPTRFKLGLSTNIRTPGSVLNCNMGSLEFNRL